MRVRDIKISIKTQDELFDEVKGVWGKLEKGRKVSRHDGISFESLDAMRKVLTEKRLKILKTIKKEHPQSIYQLAALLNRDFKNTFNDVRLLEEMGFIDLKKTKDGREKCTPEVSYDRIVLEIPVG